jgi:uncharacterized protein DUF5658
VGTLYKSLLLFGLNWLDAQLTLIWVNLNVATEGNALMGKLLEHGESSFLLFKLFIGAFAAYILYRCAHLPVARRGMKLVLGIYCALMIVHLVTGLSALGWETPETMLTFLADMPGNFLTILF